MGRHSQPRVAPVTVVAAVVKPRRPSPHPVAPPADHSVLLRRTARGAALNLAGAAVAGVAGFGTTWLAARGLGDPGRVGAYFSAVAGFTLAGGVAKLGTQTSMVYWPARLRALGARQELVRCLYNGLVPVALSAVIIAAGLGLVARHQPPAVSGALRVLALFLPLAALTDVLLAATRGYRRMRPTVALDRLLRPGLQVTFLGGLTLAALAGLIRPGTDAFAAAWALPYLPAALLAGYVLMRVHQTDRSGSGVTEYSPRRYWTFTAPRALASVAQTALQRVDVLLVALWGSLPAAALYSVAGRYVVLGQLVNGGLAQSVQPRLAERLAVGDTAGARALYQQSTAWLVLTTWPIHLLVAANAGTYLGLFGPAYPAGRSVVWILAAAMLVATACGMVDMVLSMAGRTHWNLVNVLSALAVMALLDLVLVPQFGAAGAATGLAAAIAVNNLVPLAQINRLLGLHPFGRGTRLAAGLALGTCGAPPLLALALDAGRLPVAVVSGAGLAGLAAGAYLLRGPLELPLMRGARR